MGKKVPRPPLAPLREISICYAHKHFAVINKPAGIQCEGHSSFLGHLKPQLYWHIKNHPFYRNRMANTLSPNDFKLVQRLDRHTTGGLVVVHKEKAAQVARALRSPDEAHGLKLVRRYVGILPLEEPAATLIERIAMTCTVPNGWVGDIRHDIKALTKDYRRRWQPQKLVEYQAHTKFNLIDLPVQPSTKHVRRYPGLYKDKLLYPIIFELATGRKNQIRDHVLQAFGVTLLNDDKFPQFKTFSLRGPRQQDEKPADSNINSELYESNQIGLHSGFVGLGQHEVLVEVPACDRDLWLEFLQHGILRREIATPLRLGFDTP